VREYLPDEKHSVLETLINSTLQAIGHEMQIELKTHLDKLQDILGVEYAEGK